MIVRRGFGWLTLLYVIIGAFVAGAHNYFESVGSLGKIISALLAIFLWPLVLLGISLKI